VRAGPEGLPAGEIAKEPGADEEGQLLLSFANAGDPDKRVVSLYREFGTQHSQ
jgi:hypothetical protein